MPNFITNFERGHPERERQTKEGWVKSAVFLSLSQNISKTVAGQILLEFRDISRVSEAITAKRMKIGQHSQRRYYKPMKRTFQPCIYVDIARRSHAMRRQTSAGWGKQAAFEQNASISLARWRWRLLHYFKQVVITPVLSRIMEKMLVRSILYPVLSEPEFRHLFSDQFAFRPTGSTTSALIYVLAYNNSPPRT